MDAGCDDSLGGGYHLEQRWPRREREDIHMATYTVDLFTTLDGFGTGPVGYWGKDGPELREQRARTFFAAENQTLVFGANTYRAMAQFAAAAGDDSNFASLTAAQKIVISR